MTSKAAIYYNRRLLKALTKYYRQTEIDMFSWYTDEDWKDYYCLNFIDNDGQQGRITYHKQTGHMELTLYDKPLAAEDIREWQGLY